MNDKDKPSDREWRPPLRLGTKTQWGRIASVGWVGERYYWMVKRGVVSMMPADFVEKEAEDGEGE